MFRFVASACDGDDRLRFSGLAMQPVQGPPELLAWAVRQENETPPRQWCVDGGKVRSSRAVTRCDTDFLFGIDTVHDRIVYLLDGRLFETEP